MTDVRLTATNPEDSSVVPVACNAKGELLLEETPAFDGTVDGDLNVSGSATFAGAVQIDDRLTVQNLVDPDYAINVARSAAGDFSTAGSKNLLIASGGISLGGVSSGAQIGWNVGGIKEDAYLAFGGDYVNPFFTFSDDLRFGTTPALTLTEPTILLKREGTATFAGDVVVGSRNKQWMLVEQNGLCHMVEQLRATTADLVAPAVAYPPLRDVFAELDAIEKALGEVMDKLRMAPPAGWEVWDGSSENS